MMTPEELESYRALGLPSEATAHDVKAQFRRLAKRFHPDLNPGSEWHQEQFRRIHAAYETLEDARRRIAVPAGPPHVPAGPPAESSERAWVPVGEAVPSVGTPFGSKAAPASRRRRVVRSIPRAGRITWGLAAVALFLVVIVVAGPHSGGTFAASGFAPQAPMPAVTPDALPPVVLLPITDAPTPFQGGAGGVSHSQGSGFATPLPPVEPPPADLQATPRAEFSVDAKYTQVDPAYTAVDPQYMTVNVPAMVGGQNLGVDPKDTGIDPKLMRP